MDTDRADGKAILLLILLIAVILGSLGIAKYQNKDFSTSRVKEKIDEVLNNDVVEKKELTKEELVGYVKAKMVKDGLAKEDLIADWTFDNFNKMGYLSDNPNVMYYSLSGRFLCSAFEEGYEYPTCVYQSQLGDPESGYYQWIIFVKVTMTENDYKLGELIGDGSFQYSELFVKAE